MSNKLYWRPAKNAGNILPDDLKHILRKRLNPVAMRTDERAIGYYQGLEDAGVKGATEIINAINNYGEIDLYEAE